MTFALADFNQDGKLDIVAASSAGTVSVLLPNSAPVVTVSCTTAHALEQGSAITLLTGSPTITDDASTLVGASVKITSGTVSSNEISADDDHLAVNDNGVARVVGTVNGTNISVSYNSTTETLTLNGIIGGGNAVLNLNESNSSFNQTRQLLSVTETHASDTICEGFGREKVQSRAA